MNVLKYIYSLIPTTIKWILLSIFVLPILGKIVSEGISEEGINISLNKFLYLLVFAIILLAIGFFIGSFRSVRILLSTEKSENIGNVKQKKILSVNQVNIGQYKDENLAVAIIAEINLTDEIQPNIEDFIKRVSIGEPFCPQCLRPLDIYHTSWQVDGSPDGFQCEECNTKRQGLKSDIIKDIIKEIRFNYKEYYEKYHSEIDKLTKGKPQQYNLPIFL